MIFKRLESVIKKKYSGTNQVVCWCVSVICLFQVQINPAIWQKRENSFVLVQTKEDCEDLSDDNGLEQSLGYVSAKYI